MSPAQNTSNTLTARYEQLQTIIRSYQKVIIAYSGGVDSAFLLRVACDCLGSENILACIGDSQSLARDELSNAKNLAQQMNAQVEIVHPNEMADPDYQANPAQRCYHCKTHLYNLLNAIARDRKYDAVFCGSNVDDLTDFRPGLQAAKKYNIVSPLAQAQLTKSDIRILSKQLQLPTWDKPASPCLASRIAYGLEITPERLAQIEQGEAFLHKMNLGALRVRHHGTLVRLEVPTDQIQKLTENNCREKIVAFFKELGFTYITLDLQGFRSGSGNEVL